MSYMQDAICPKCGMIFRTRAHSVDCTEGLYDQRLLDAALAVHQQQIADLLEKLRSEHE